MADEVSAFYYRLSNYTDARALLEEGGDRASPPRPWWALNRYGLCQLILGFPGSALAAFERALLVAPTQEEKGTTLNNLSQIYKARGDYDTALRYLEASLAMWKKSKPCCIVCHQANREEVRRKTSWHHAWQHNPQRNLDPGRQGYDTP